MSKLNKREIILKLEEKGKSLKKLGVNKIGLFGSFAKGKQHEKSDVDFLVTFDSPSFDNYAETIILLEKLFKRKIDLVTLQSLRPELNYVKKEVEYARI